MNTYIEWRYRERKREKEKRKGNRRGGLTHYLGSSPKCET